MQFLQTFGGFQSPFQATEKNHAKQGKTEDVEGEEVGETKREGNRNKQGHKDKEEKEQRKRDKGNKTVSEQPHLCISIKIGQCAANSIIG